MSRRLFEASCGQHLAWSNSGAECGNVSHLNKRGPDRFLADVEKERQDGTDGEWQQETTYKENLDLVRHSSDSRFDGVLMRRAYEAGSQENGRIVSKCF